MVSANFKGFSTIYDEDILEKVKSCEFHLSKAVEQKIRGFDRDKDQFKKLAHGLPYATTPEAYENSLQLFEEFAVDAKMSKDWIQWWDVRKEKIFHALLIRKWKWEEERASQLGEDLLNFGVTSRSTNPTKKKQIEPPETDCYPPKKKKNIKEMMQRKVATARSDYNIIKITKS